MDRSERGARDRAVAGERVETRAEPLPEERRVESGSEDHEAQAAEILHESEERLARAAEAEHPADAADQHRASEETV